MSSFTIWMIEGTVPSAVADYTNLGPVTNILKGHAAIRRHLSRLEKWADRKIMKGNFKKGMYNILCLELRIRVCWGLTSWKADLQKRTGGS